MLYPMRAIVLLFLLALVEQERWPRPLFFYAEVSAPLSCPLRILTNFSKSSVGSCGAQLVIHVFLAHFVTSEPDVFTGVELVSRATYISRKTRNLETRQRQYKAYKRAEREAKTQADGPT